MISAPWKHLLKELSWLAALAAALTIQLGVALVRLDSSRGRTEALSRDIGRKLELLKGNSPSTLDQGALEGVQAALEEWRERAASEAHRVETISSAAAQAGVRLLSLRELPTRQSEDGRVEAFAHRLRGEGDYRQLGAFLDALYGSDMLAVEGLEMGHGEATRPGLVQASMQVTWFAPRPADPALEEAYP